MTDAPKIIQNSSGVWQLEGEQLWDTTILPVCLEHIKEGDTVIDAGAWIGGHTMAYAEKVGAKGKVIAFEPNHAAFECLSRNIPRFGNAYCYEYALGDKFNVTLLSINKGWYDSGFIGEGGKISTEVLMDTLDSFNIAPSFIKIDVEGCELKVLKGAAKTIEKSRPIMVIEVNHPALKRQGNTATAVFDFLLTHDYTYAPIDNYMADVYNILCTP